MPGYGYARISSSEKKRLRELVDQYLLEAEGLALVIIVLDARRKLESEELNILKYCKTTSLQCVMARTKWDRLNTKEKNDARKIWKNDGVEEICIAVSSTKRIGLDKILKMIRETAQGIKKD